MKTKVNRESLGGYSRSEFKTLLRSFGFNVSRTFFRDSCIAEHRNRQYRFRHWGSCEVTDSSFVVDIAEKNSTFDRWANSTESVITFEEFLSKFRR